MKQRSKKIGFIGIALIVLMLAVTIVVDVLCAVNSDAINLFFRDRSADTDEVIAAANAYTVEQEAGGMVLMKNENNALPLTNTTTANLFGALSAKQLYLGTGSAGGWNWDPSAFVNLKTALGEVGVSVNDELWQFYSDLTGDAGSSAGSVTDMQGSTHSIVDVPLDYAGYAAARAAAESYSDTAIVVVGRAGGEGSDAVMDMTPYEAEGRNGVTRYNQGGAAGYHYLELMPQERALVDYVKATYQKVIVLVNTPMPIELDFVDGAQNSDGKGNVDAVLWIGMPGSTGNRAVAQALKGTISPSGRLADTWAYEVESAPSYYNFGDYTYANVTNAGNNGALKYLHYQEGIYVGYRWYETANAMQTKLDGVPNYHAYIDMETDGKGLSTTKSFDFADYDSVVQYPFGYGLSYTSFGLAFDDTPAYDAASKTFTFNVNVTNTGSTFASRTPVELYVEAPYDAQEGIERSKVVLRTFAKTGELAPGESETVTLTVARDDLASYDYAASKAYKLSDGDYKFYVDYGKYGSHCWANTADTANVLNWTYNIDADVVFSGENKRDSDLTAATNQFEDVAKGDGSYTPGTDDLRRDAFSATFPAGYAAGTELNTVDENTARRLNDNVFGATLEGYDPDTYRYTGEFATADGEYRDPTGGYTTFAQGQSGELSCADLVGVAFDDELWNNLIGQMSQSDIERLIASCGWQNPEIRSIGKNFAVDMDGAEGLHDLVSDIDANCYTCAPITAASFDRDLAYEMGSTYAEECLANGVSGMYGFSTNTHRSPFGGRAFEYYSEDGTLAGLICASQTSGLQDKGIAVYTKHFAFNEQETNRSGVHTWLNEQAAREIYLRPYELICRNATAEGSILDGNTGFMTAYNSIGTSHTSAHYPMLTNILRGEWGFNGRIITDAGGTDSISCSVRAGLDMNLGFSQTGRLDSIEGLDNTRGYGLMKVQQAAKHQLYVFVNSSGITTVSSLNTAWIAIPICLSILLIAGAVVIAIFMVVPAFKKKQA